MSPAAGPRAPRFYAALRKHCLGKPDATEDHPWGDIAFKVKGKIFAVTGPGKPLRVSVKADPAEAPALCTHPAIERAAYVGRFGWVTVTIETEAVLGLALELVDASYLLVAGGRGKGKRAGTRRQ
jgi:predicted DNA-binding protein (MmcQ/YjbR family)